MDKKIPDWFRDMKLRNKLIVNYICFGLIPLLIVGTFAIYRVKNFMFSQEAARNQDYINQAISGMDGQIRIYNNLSDYIAFSSQVARVCEGNYESKYQKYIDYTQGVHSLISSMKYFHEEIERITIYVDDDIVEYEDSIIPINKIQKKSWYHIVKKDNKLHWFLSRKNKKVFVARKIPLLNDNKKTNILYIEIDYSYLFQWFEEMTDTQYGVYILDNDGEVLYNIQNFTDKNKNNKLLLEEVVSEKNKPKNYIITEQKTKENNWSVYLYRSSEGIYKKISSILQGCILGILVSVVLSIICTRVITNKTIKGIEELRNHMKEVENGKLELQIYSDSQDEVGDLIRGFERMLYKIKVLVEEVYEGKIKQKEYEMRALQAQINPHFLYNSLSLINWMALEEDNEEISKITLAMSSFYRTALNKGKNIILLKDEIENMRSYLEIQLMMHNYEFDVEIEVEDDILEYYVINLILQPMVENAIDHGIDHKIDGRGKLLVQAKSEENMIVIFVQDNGVGMEKETIQTILTKQSKGYGLYNVNERIKLYYGEQYHLVIESEIGVGTRIITKIPKTKKEKYFS